MEKLKNAKRWFVEIRVACETVRQAAGDGPTVPGRSAQLADIVPAGARYGFDLIAHVGVETYLHGRSLQDLREELARRRPAIAIPLSTLWDPGLPPICTSVAIPSRGGLH